MFRHVCMSHMAKPPMTLKHSNSFVVEMETVNRSSGCLQYCDKTWPTVLRLHTPTFVNRRATKSTADFTNSSAGNLIHSLDTILLERCRLLKTHATAACNLVAPYKN